jgi:hypothetical protein
MSLRPLRGLYMRFGASWGPPPKPLWRRKTLTHFCDSQNETKTMRLNGETELGASFGAISCVVATLCGSSLPEFVPMSLGPPGAGTVMGRGGGPFRSSAENIDSDLPWRSEREAHDPSKVQTA